MKGKYVKEKGEAKIQGESKRNARRFPFLYSNLINKCKETNLVFLNNLIFFS